MKPFVDIFKFLTIFLLIDFVRVESENNRIWLEIGRELFFVEPEGRCTWKQAVSACKRVQSQLIRSKSEYDYTKLKKAIQRNFKNYSSLWTNEQVKSENFFHLLGLGDEQNKRRKCYKFDNSSTFKFLPDNCSSRLGFICEKSLLQTESLFYNKDMMYFVQPKKNFSCVKAYEQCQKRQMILTLSEDHENNKLLQDFLFINYGSAVNFWFGFTHETSYKCETMTKNRFVGQDSKLGFICQKASVKKSVLTGRHIILLIFVAVAATLAVIVFILIKCCYLKRTQSLDILEEEIGKESIVTDIK